MKYGKYAYIIFLLHVIILINIVPACSATLDSVARQHFNKAEVVE